MHFIAYTHSGLQKIGTQTDLIKLVVEVCEVSFKLELPSSPAGGGNALSSDFSNRQKTQKKKKTLWISLLNSWFMCLS